MNKLLFAQPLWGQKPSDLLHELVQYCPEGESQTRIFSFLFLQRLPVELRNILSKDKDLTLPALAARRDQLWAHSARQPHDAAVNAVTDKPWGGPACGVGLGGNTAGGAAAGAEKARPPGWHSSLQACVATTGGTAKRPTTTASPARGRETRGLGGAQ
jgi:hypothetical protein